MMEDSGFRDEDSIHEGFGVVRGNHADGSLHVGDNAKKDTADESRFRGYIDMSHVIREVFLFLPVLVPDESSAQLDVVAGAAPELAHGGPALSDHVQKHLRQLRILVQVDQVGKTVVHFEGHPCFLKTTKRQNSFSPQLYSY